MQFGQNRNYLYGRLGVLGQKPIQSGVLRVKNHTKILSFRVGAAVDLVESGYSIEQVMRKGDWKSAQASIRYVMVK